MKYQFEVLVRNGKLSIGKVTEGPVPDANFVIGGGWSDTEEILIVMMAPPDGSSTLRAQAGTSVWPRRPGRQ